MSKTNFANVDRGSVISFSKGIAQQTQKDVVYSILFAQIAADIRYDRFTQTTDWLKYYAQTLEQMGWTIGEITNLAVVTDPGRGSSVDEVVSRLASKYRAEEELTAFIDAVQAMQNKENKKSMEQLNSRALRASKATFQVGSTTLEGDNPMLKLSTYVYTTSETISNALFHQFENKPVFLAGNITMVLNTAVYNMIRQTVEEKLGDKVDENVFRVEL